MKTNNNHNSEGGFTLVELLGVVCILITLVSVAIMGVDGARERGREAAILRAEQTLNSSLQNFIAAGGSLEGLSEDDYVAAGDELISRLQSKVKVGDSEVGPFLAAPPKIAMRRQGLWLRLQYNTWGQKRFVYFTAAGWNPEREDGQQ